MDPVAPRGVGGDSNSAIFMEEPRNQHHGGFLNLEVAEVLRSS
jgi:hypothetical protein